MRVVVGLCRACKVFVAFPGFWIALVPHSNVVFLESLLGFSASLHIRALISKILVLEVIELG